MAYTAWKFSGAQNQFSSLTATINNLGNLGADDGSTASSNPAKNNYTNWLVLSSFGFTTSDIPYGSTIDSIEIEVNHWGAGSDIEDHLVYTSRLISNAYWGDWYGSSNMGAQASIGTSSSNVDTYTQSTSLPSDFTVRDPQFGAALQWRNENDSNAQQVYIDYVKMRVQYTAPAANTRPCRVIGTASKGANTSGTPSVTLSSGDVVDTQAGDLLILVAQASAAGSIPTPSGWTLEASHLTSADTYSYIFSKEAASSSENVTVTASSTAGSIVAQLIVVTGAEMTGTTFSIGSSYASANPPARTFGVNDLSLLVLFAGSDGVTSNMAPPSGWTRIGGFTVDHVSGGTDHCVFGTAIKEISSAGSDDPGTWTADTGPTFDAYHLCIYAAPVEYSVTPVDAAHPHSAEAGSVASKAVVPPDQTVHSHYVDGVTITNKASVSASEASHSHTSDAASVTSKASISSAEASHPHSSDAVVVTSENSVIPASTDHAHASEDVTLVWGGVVSPASADHDHTSGEATVSSGSSLLVSNAAHAQTSENVTLSWGGDISPASVDHDHSADGSSMSFNAQVVVSEASHGHLSGAVPLTPMLYPQETLHSLVSDDVALAPAYNVSAEEALHSMASTEVGVVPGYSVSVQSIAHDHAAEEPSLDFNVSIATQGALHAHSADAASMDSASLIFADGSDHGHTSEQLSVSFEVTVAPEGSEHSVVSGSVSIGSGYAPLINSSIHSHLVDSTTVSTTNPVTPNPADHGFTSDQVIVTHSAALLVSEASHSHQAEVVNVAVEGSILVAATGHSHSTDIVLIATASTALVSASEHSQTSEEVVVAVGAALDPQEALHGHSAEGVIVATEVTIYPSRSEHIHTVDAVLLASYSSALVDSTMHGHAAGEVDVVSRTVSAQSALHGMASDSPSVSYEYQVTPDGCNQLHFASSPDLSTAYGMTPNSTLHSHLAISPTVSGLVFEVYPEGADHDVSSTVCIISIRNRSAFQIVA